MSTRRSLRQIWVGAWLVAALATSAVAVQPQDPAPAPQDSAAPSQTPDTQAPTTNPAATNSEIEAVLVPQQSFTDASGRFGFVAPARWGRLPSSADDEVVFESETGDSLSVSVQPLKVDPKAFAGAYVDTYLKVLAQSFADVRFIGQREVSLNFRKATDYVFSARLGDTPAILHQVVLLGLDRVLYMTFVGFGRTRTAAEAQFRGSVESLWVSAAFGGSTTASLADPNAPAYVLAIPEGWVDQGPGDGSSHMFRPPNSRQTAAFISTRAAKLPTAEPLKTVDDGFVAAYAESVKAQHADGMFELRQTSRLFLGGEPAVRYDFHYISNYGIRRGFLVLSVRKGYLVGITCDSAEQSYPLYEGAFETLVSGFKFKS